MSEENEPTMEITNGTEVLCFLSQFDFWNLAKSGSGKFSIVVRHDGKYVKAWGRKDETLIAMVERLRQKLKSQ